MSLINKNKIHIPLYYKIVKNRKGLEVVIVLDEDEAKKILADDKKSKEVNILNTYWNSLSWGEFKKIQSASIEINQVTGLREVNLPKFNDYKVKTCLKEWDLKDDKGQLLPVNEKNIEDLPLSVIGKLLDLYQESSEGVEEEQKK